MIWQPINPQLICNTSPRPVYRAQEESMLRMLPCGNLMEPHNVTWNKSILRIIPNGNLR